MTTADLLITGGDVLPVDDDGTFVRNGAVAVRDGAIVSVGPQGDGSAHEVIDATGCLVMPGLINAHTHLAMTLLRGIADDVDLQGFLARVIPAEASLTPERIATGVEIALAESIRGGVTAALDMYWYPEAAIEVAERTGFRLLTGPSFMDVPSPPDGLDFTARLTQSPDRPYVQPHSTYTLDRDQLVRVRDLARERGAYLNIHAAENPGEVEMVLARHGRRPVELLADLELLGPDTVLAHAVVLTDEEITLLAETGTSIAHCPASNLKLGSGIARVPDLLAAGVTVGLGTDGAVSSNTLDMFTALRIAALLHTAVTAEQAVRMATINGARAVGASDRIGSLEVGKRADIVVIDLDAPHLTPAHDPWSMLAYAATAADVRDTIVDGRILMRNRQGPGQLGT